MGVSTYLFREDKLPYHFVNSLESREFSAVVHVRSIGSANPVTFVSKEEAQRQMDSTPIQVTYVIMGVLALLPIYFGSFASLKVMPSLQV
jgi:hypothetical protein